MKERTREQREAIRVFEKLRWMSILSYKGRHGGVGYHTERLSDDDREKIKHLSSDDINGERII